MNKALYKKLSYIYISCISFSIIPLLIYTTPTILHVDLIPYLLFWIILEIAADLKPFRVMHYQQMEMTMSFAVQLSAIILLGTKKAIWIVIIATLIVEIINKKTWYRVLFNAGQYALSMLVTGVLFHMLKVSSSNVPLDIILDMPAILIAVTI